MNNEQPMASSAIVEARNVHKTYETGRVSVRALQGLDLIVERGEMVAIMGPRGCGKTTLLNCLSGLDDIDGGEIVIEGTALSAMSDRQRTDYRARRMGFVFQFYNLMPVLSAVENIELPLLVARVRGVAGLGFLGVALDSAANAGASGDAEIGATDASARTLVVTAREDLEVARQVRALLA